MTNSKIKYSNINMLQVLLVNVGYDYFIVDKRAGVIESLERRWKVTRGTFWDLFLFGLLLFGINLMELLCLMIGLFATIPTSMVSYAFVYRKLLVQMESA